MTCKKYDGTQIDDMEYNRRLDTYYNNMRLYYWTATPT